MALDDLGNPKVDYVWGNMPMQPNYFRDDTEAYLLGVGDSHKIDSVLWNYYPETGDADGATRNIEGTPSFTWPRLWLCENQTVDENSKVTNVINEFVSYGVPAEYFKDFTFSGGETKWDPNGEPNWGSGCIFYYYLPPYETFGTTWYLSLIHI